MKNIGNVKQTEVATVSLGRSHGCESLFSNPRDTSISGRLSRFKKITVKYYGDFSMHEIISILEEIKAVMRGQSLWTLRMTRKRASAMHTKVSSWAVPDVLTFAHSFAASGI